MPGRSVSYTAPASASLKSPAASTSVALPCDVSLPLRPKRNRPDFSLTQRYRKLTVLQQGKPRRLTQLSSLEVYKAGLNGIYYRSRYGHDLENWALFEPFQIRVIGDAEVIRLGDPDLLAACEILGLQIES